jgi:cytochrome c
MKHSLLLLSAFALLTACNSGYQQDGPDVKNKENAAASTQLNQDSASETNLAAVARQPQIDTSVTKIGNEHAGGLVSNGAKLISGSDCLGCHKEREKLVGPAYTAVAQKYPSTEANIAMLSKKIITGGKGNWGEIPMTPHPGLSETDAKEMVKYILSLK